MKKHRGRIVIRVLLLALAFVVTGMLGACNLPFGQTGSNAKGGATVPQTRTFKLYVRDNWLTMPDGKKAYVFGYTDNPKGPAQLPGPTLVVNEGDKVNVILINDKDPTKTQYNTTGDGHTIHLHGLDLYSASDGDPMTTPPRDANGKVLPYGAKGKGVQTGSLKQGEQFTYSFIADHAGTYWYHCHQSTPEHIQMGMYGAIIIRPVGQPNHAYLNSPAFDVDSTFVLSDLDLPGHNADYNTLYKNAPDVNWTNSKISYALLNGKAWPETLKDSRSVVNAKAGQTVLLRLVNAGTQVYTLSAPGLKFQTIGTDGRKLSQYPISDTISLGPAEHNDVLVHVDHAGTYTLHEHIDENVPSSVPTPDTNLTTITVK
ncbi:multicopper oxidase family protein [Dictyobacter aurantiacus]|nr:multicopper oxidase family protein [Dictyobacter aurantiacus]